MNVKILPFLSDNYMFMITDSATKRTVAIDPAVSEPIFNQVAGDDLIWEHIFTTHHHPWHQQGNIGIKNCKDNMKIIGGDDRIAGLNHKVRHFDVLEVGCMRFRCLHTPCHTSGHFCYYVESSCSWQRCIFTGDLLFSGGAGHLAEGIPAEMYHSLQMLYALPNDTRIFCGHETTIKNLEFAVKVEPTNINVAQRLTWACEHAKDGLPPMLSTIGQEKLFNPFFRVHERSVQEYCKTSNPYCIVRLLNEELYKQSGQEKEQ